MARDSQRRNGRGSAFRRNNVYNFENAMFKETSLGLNPLRLGKHGPPRKKTVEDLEREWINCYNVDPPKHPKSSCHAFWDKIVIAGYDSQKAKDVVTLRSLEGGWANNYSDQRTKPRVYDFERPHELSALDPTPTSLNKRIASKCAGCKAPRGGQSAGETKETNSVLRLQRATVEQ